jgi:hypothetical protein
MPSSAKVGIDPSTAAPSDNGVGVPWNAESFAQMRVTEVWAKYAGRLNWGKGQCLAILDDGCDITTPEWQARLPWGPKVIATYNSIDDNDDPTPVPPGYHGTTVGYPSSINHNGVLGVAYNNQVAQVRSNTIVHLRQDESETIACALQWVINNRERYNITTVNLAAVDDQPHREPMPTAIDDKLLQLRQLGVWVSAPCANNGYTDGISWPACQPHCFAIGATVPGRHEAHLDRYSNTDILVVAPATSSSNAYAVGCAMILREAIEVSGYNWQNDGETLPDAMMAIFQKTGVEVFDPATNLTFRELDLLAAVDSVFGE